ncbi:unnamed protein product [Orchesella dallaii]|uniref:Uncharacterized protein n=1 Tax=Orchesella dallaii TaxID=48710 RepID=A0ABP1R0L7_9HEXA
MSVHTSSVSSEKKWKCSDTGARRFANEDPPASFIVEFDGGQRQSPTQNSASLPRARNTSELV